MGRRYQNASALPNHFPLWPPGRATFRGPLPRLRAVPGVSLVSTASAARRLAGRGKKRPPSRAVARHCSCLASNQSTAFAAAVFFARRYPANARLAKPIIIIAQVDGSGTPVETRDEPTSPVQALSKSQPEVPAAIDRSATKATLSELNGPPPEGEPIMNGSEVVAPPAASESPAYLGSVRRACSPA
jgi:hypothetical protein